MVSVQAEAVVRQSRVCPDELVPGDVVLAGGARFEVLGEPFAGVAGASVFDARRLFWRARVRPLEDANGGGERYLRWWATETVGVAAPEEERTS